MRYRLTYVNTSAPISTTQRASAILSAATSGLPAPISVIDLAAFDANGRTMVSRAHGHPIRVATKSLRVRALLERALAIEGFSGLMAYSLREALWLVGEGMRDILVAYPTVDADALRELGANELALAEITLMTDCSEHLDLIAAAHPVRPVRIAIDVDSSLRILSRTPFPIHLGVRRSPLHTEEDVTTYLDVAQRNSQVNVVGLMFYDAQIAGLPDSSPAVRLVKKISRAELAQRRAEIVAAMKARVGQLDIINAGGTGSLHTFDQATEITEVTAGSGFYHPGLFDGYENLGLEPAAYFGLDVVRTPTRGIVTAFAGGYVASGQAKRNRQPKPINVDLTAIGTEGAGEVQTPLVVRKGAPAPRIGDRVWLRNAKAGEQMERFNMTYLLEGESIVDKLPTYRGEGKNFG